MKANKEGVWGEIFAARYMKENGYKIISGNYSCRFGEVDIVGKRDGYVCFVEVKTRSEGAISEPKEAVDKEKQQNLLATSEMFRKVFPCLEQSRFDVCEVYINDKIEPVKINYIENAFNG